MIINIILRKENCNLLLKFFPPWTIFWNNKNIVNKEKLNDSLEYSAYLEIKNFIHSLKHKELNDELRWIQINKINY